MEEKKLYNIEKKINVALLFILLQLLHATSWGTLLICYVLSRVMFRKAELPAQTMHVLTGKFIFCHLFLGL